ncbi:hypothetical protein [Aureibaculum conchae]|uniref:hypothetical protein n=1 Tax=Aureibaculum sp. 2308TA14-22 TaxID=3108392 RepID=UPI0033908C3C
MIKKTEHCLLCENQKHNFENGVYCGLTDKKPDFEKTCNLIKFGNALEDSILEKNVELRLVERTKVDTIGHLVIFLLIGLCVVFFGSYLLDIFGIKLLTHRGGVRAEALMPMVFIVLIGIGLIVFAVAPVNLYRRNLKVAKTNKEKLDKILDEYNLTYTLDLSLHKKWPNDIEVEHKLNVNSKHQKGSHFIK